jgi:hypothetical protein
MTSLERGAIRRWLRDAPRRFGDNLDTHIHYDELFGIDAGTFAAIDLIRFTCEVAVNLERMISKSEELRDVVCFVIELPYRETLPEVLRTSWRRSDWKKVERASQSPAILLGKRELLHDLNVLEKYTRRLDIPIDGFPTVRALFRSWKYQNGALSGVVNGIYFTIPITGRN